MRTVGVPILLAISIFGCSRQQGTPEVTDAQTALHSNEVDSQQRINAPRLWMDEDAASMIKVVSGLFDPEDKVYVARWENGAVRGQAQLESVDDSKPLSFDLSVPSDRTFRKC